MKALVILAVLGSAVWFGLSSTQTATVAKSTSGNRPGDIGKKMDILKAARDKGHDLAIFAGGCFWGFESSFRQQPGVIATAVGYTGGSTKNPTYESVCSKSTGHAEAVLVEFDPKKTTYEALVRSFFSFHDPTQVNRQGPDVGSNYRSALFYYDDEQKATALKVKDELQKDKYKTRQIATQFAKASEFWMAEDYHQQYYEKRGIAPACGIGG